MPKHASINTIKHAHHQEYVYYTVHLGQTPEAGPDQP